MHKIEVQFSQSLARFAVSLFTREWIEISIKSSQVCETTTSPSLRGSGLKSFNLDTAKKEVTSPSLRGSGLKYWSGCRCSECSQVSLFTREWIEMPCSVDRCRADCCVSLFTREWIEICSKCKVKARLVSPSLRGSGLKYFQRLFEFQR